MLRASADLGSCCSSCTFSGMAGEELQAPFRGWVWFSSLVGAVLSVPGAEGATHCPQSNCEHWLQPEASTQAKMFLVLLSYSDKYHNSSQETSGQNCQTLTLLGCHRAVQYFNLIMATEEQFLGIRHFHLHPSPVPALADVSCCMGERDLSHPQRKYHPLPETGMTRAG